MPLYSFQCPKCGNRFELFLRQSEASRGVQCPACPEEALLQEDNGPATAGASCDLAKKT
ncbi:MAG: zinc ribbon domain-containing protein [Desulfobacteraceae bacterium]|nr:MAG: zinc ribbon domain-containing protein [Desulfobacteraceae bacterium]